MSLCARMPRVRPVDKGGTPMRTKFTVMKLGATVAALVALAVETGAAQKFG